MKKVLVCFCLLMLMTGCAYNPKSFTTQELTAPETVDKNFDYAPPRHYKVISNSNNIPLTPLAEFVAEQLFSMSKTHWVPNSFMYVIEGLYFDEEIQETSTCYIYFSKESWSERPILLYVATDTGTRLEIGEIDKYFLEKVMDKYLGIKKG